MGKKKERKGRTPPYLYAYTSVTDEPVDDTLTFTTRLTEEAYGEVLLYAVRK
jgi:hypothetical protein